MPNASMARAPQSDRVARFTPLLCGLILVAALGAAPTSEAGPVELAWDANTEPDLAGYYLAYGTTSGVYTTTINVGNNTSYTVNVPDGSVYYFVVRAYSTAGLVSDNSDEVAAWVFGSCSYSISSVSATAGGAGGTGTVGVAAQPGCAWTATSQAAWLTVTSGASSFGNGVVGYSVAVNTSASPRSATLTIANQIFTVTQPGLSCSYTISPTSVSFGPTAGTGVVSVTAPAGCPWTSSSNASWLSVTGGATGSGVGATSYAVSANPGASRTGTMSVAGRTVTVSQQGTELPTLSLSPSPLRYGAVNMGGGVLGPATPGQLVTVTQSGAGTVTWTATANQPWIQITSGSGVGTGMFTVSVRASAQLPVTGTASGIVTVTANGAASSPTLPVYLTVYRSGTTSMPFGQIDTPVQNAVGLVGSVGVTGWALDDVGVSSVKLYRNCLAFEPAANCGWVEGLNLVYMGEADIVPGARPDVESAYSTTPQPYRGGWGYLLLTNMLPHVPTAQLFGGQGPISIYAFATDMEGHARPLGRTVYTQTPTNVTMANDTATRPFGAIDTPRQGETVSGALWNFGWALTPDTDLMAGPGDIEVPTTGATVMVWIDGAPVSTPIFNLCRGTVGSPVPAGVFCDDDVSNIFGNPTPRLTLDPRLANPTKYRNLDAGRGPIGAFYLDTTRLSNGRHSIVWGVTDSAGRTDGIGSRDFIVFNGSSAPAAQVAAVASIAAVGDTADLTGRPLATGEVWGRTGFDFRAPWTVIEPQSDGTRDVQMPQMGRIELYLGASVTAGYLQVGDTLRPLPAGSRLEVGRFTWVPGPAYVGAYSLIFTRDTDRLSVTVTVHAASQPSSIEAYIDTPSNGTAIRGPFLVGGWALSPTAWVGTGIGAVHVWAHRRDVPSVAPTFLGVAELSVWRPDVGAVFGQQFERAGWQLVAPALPPGVYDVVAYFWSSTTGQFEYARAVRVNAR